MEWMKKEVAMKRNQSQILRNLTLALAVLLCLALPAYADMGPKADLTVTVVNAPEGECYVDLLYEDTTWTCSTKEAAPTFTVN